jgi:acetylglutamate kinase
MHVEFVEGLRVSDEATVEIAKMVLVGKQNKDIVLSLNHHGQSAVGLSGDDGGLFQVRKTLARGDIDIGFVGEIVRVDTDVLRRISENYIPVIASVGADLQGHSYNINADEAAAAVAKALGAEKLIFLTDVPGWLEDASDETSRISQATADQVRDRLSTLSGGMLPKLQACADAVENGVSASHIIDGREPHSVLLELFTNEGIGTKVTP